MPSVQLRRLDVAIAQGGNNRRYIDLERIGLITKVQLRQASGANPQGFADPKMFDIQPIHQ